ncbi:hypothetical protein ACHAPC_003029 [Botrytis cinerea]|uniref:BZIP domain-containing protein n=1 Tax=Botryotinia fuckeliana (strain T4) TaxID=999810 RepID=G2YAT0_BOTF4|nr:hypothetical protein BofuT4_P027050.1 [Botrytis cinerea T4]
MPLKVELTRMSQQTGTRCMDEDWTGTNDTATRRKLQNRLNQRIYRQRRKAPSKIRDDRENDSLIEAPQSPERSILGEAKRTYSANPLSITSLRNEKQSGQLEQSSNPSAKPSADINIKQWTTGRVSRVQGFCGIRLMLAEFEKEARRNHSMGSPRTDQLLTLIQFNVFRALIKNTRTIGWNLDWLDCTIDPLSPWLNLSTKIVPGAHCPQALCPTKIQRTIPHHPWLDLWPIPQMRDNLLLHAESYDEDQLCNDLVEFGGLMNEQSGLIVWGEPWDVWGWEVSETFLRNWGWAVKGCGELLASTNKWRAKRGEEALVFEV